MEQERGAGGALYAPKVEVNDDGTMVLRGRFWAAWGLAILGVWGERMCEDRGLSRGVEGVDSSLDGPNEEGLQCS